MTYDCTAPATPEAQQWNGHGTALKPAHEPIVLARKPLDGTIAGNVLKHGVGGLNIEQCRVGTDLIQNGRAGRSLTKDVIFNGLNGMEKPPKTQGRFPANFMHDGSPEVLAGFPNTKATGATDYDWEKSGDSNPVHKVNNIRVESTMLTKDQPPATSIVRRLVPLNEKGIPTPPSNR